MVLRRRGSVGVVVVPVRDALKHICRGTPLFEVSERNPRTLVKCSSVD